MGHLTTVKGNRNQGALSFPTGPGIGVKVEPHLKPGKVKMSTPDVRNLELPAHPKD